MRVRVFSAQFVDMNTRDYIGLSVIERKYPNICLALIYCLAVSPWFLSSVPLSDCCLHSWGHDQMRDFLKITRVVGVAYRRYHRWKGLVGALSPVGTRHPELDMEH